MEENAVQFLNGAAQPNLSAFVSNATPANLGLLVPVPVLYTVADHEFGYGGRIHSTTLAVFRWIYIRAFVVLQQLFDQGSGARELENVHSRADVWQKVGYILLNQVGLIR